VRLDKQFSPTEVSGSMMFVNAQSFKSTSLDIRPHTAPWSTLGHIVRPDAIFWSHSRPFLGKIEAYVQGDVSVAAARDHHATNNSISLCHSVIFSTSDIAIIRYNNAKHRRMLFSMMVIAVCTVLML
jgi:hypothetical protein